MAKSAKEELKELNDQMAKLEVVREGLRQKQMKIECDLREGRIAWLRRNVDMLLEMVDHVARCSLSGDKVQTRCTKCLLMAIKDNPDVYIPSSYEVEFSIQIRDVSDL